MSEIRIPFPDPIEPDDLIMDVHDAIRRSPELDDGERELAQAVVFQALERGTTRAVDLAEELEGPGARTIVDEARTSIGMKTVGEEEADKEWKLVNTALPPSEGPRFQVCAAENCNVYPLNALGVPIEVPDRVWWCDQHKDHAGPDDHLPPEPKYMLDLATMSERPIGAEKERLLEEDRERKRKAREREERRREEAKALAEVQDRYAEVAKPINIGGWLVDGKGRIVDDR